MQSVTGGDADLLMECEEEKQEVWPQSSGRDEGAGACLSLKIKQSFPLSTDHVRVSPLCLQFWRSRH